MADDEPRRCVCGEPIEEIIQETEIDFRFEPCGHGTDDTMIWSWCLEGDTFDPLER